MTNVQKIFEKHIQSRATNTYKAHEFIREYGFFISIVLIVKLATSLFSGYAGYYYCKSMFLEVLNSELSSILFSILALILIEFLTNISLSKFYKTSLRGNIKAAIGFLILSFIFFGLQFLVSSTGLAQRQSQKADNTSIILQKYITNVNEAKKSTENRIINIKSAIETIKQNPSGWRNSKRDVLQPNQLKEINSYYSDIELLNKQLFNDLQLIDSNKKEELKQNSGNLLVIENKYYYTVSTIMLIQLFVNGLIMFFYSKIYQDKEKETYTKEVIQTFASDINNSTDDMIKKQISNTYHNYLNALMFTFDENQIEQVKMTKSKKIGFHEVSTDSNYNDIVITDDKKNKSNVISKGQLTDSKPCKYCQTTFKPYSKIQIFCTNACRLNWHKKTNGFDLQMFKNRKH